MYLVWIICYQRIATPYTRASRSLTCPGAGSSDPCHAITDPGRCSRRQGERAPEQLRSWSSWPTDPGPPAAGCWLLARWGPRTGAHLLLLQSTSDQPAGQCAQGQVLFRMIDDFVRVLRWASICFVGPVHHLCCLSRCLPTQPGLPYALSCLCPLTVPFSFPKLCPALPNHGPFLICADSKSVHSPLPIFSRLCTYFFCPPPPGPLFSILPRTRLSHLSVARPPSSTQSQKRREGPSTRPHHSRPFSPAYVY